MALFRLEDLEASSRRSFGQHDLIHLEVYTPQEEKAGEVVDILIDENGQFQYLVVTLGDRESGKQVLLPKGEFQVDPVFQRIYTDRACLRGLLFC